MIVKILILEDDQNRVHQFSRNFVNAEITFVSTVTDCKNKLIDETWDLLFLDHDLGGNQMVESGGKEETGYDVAQFLSINTELQPVQIYTHSLNPAGRKNISALVNASEVPFIWTKHIEFNKRS